MNRNSWQQLVFRLSLAVLLLAGGPAAPAGAAPEQSAVARPAAAQPAEVAAFTATADDS
jgi:hypothetical protein